jgi:hypothetical protein
MKLKGIILIAITVAILAFFLGCTTAGSGSGSSTSSRSSRSDTREEMNKIRPEVILWEQLQKTDNPDAMGQGWSVASPGQGFTFLRSRPYNPIPLEGDEEISIGFVQLYEGKNDKPSLAFTDVKAFNMYYGAATAISPDESVVVIGAPGITTDAESYLYTYRKSPKGWKIKEDEIYPTLFGVSGGKGSNLGMDVDLSGESGTTIVCGAPTEGGYGRARYFVQPEGGWDTLTNENMMTGYLGLASSQRQAGDEFGRSVAISRNDEIIVIGAPGRNNNGGAVYVFKKPEGGWINTQTLYPIRFKVTQPGDRCGQSVAVSDDGSIIAITAPGAEGGKGAVYVLTNFRIENQVSFDSIRINNVSEHLNMGISMDMSSDGTIIAVGGLGVEHSGFFLVFQSTDKTWKEHKNIAKLYADTQNENELGSMIAYSLDLADDGSFLIIGAPMFNDGVGTTFRFDLTEYLLK